jgi:dsDNA-binding SOS-regulon protein
MNAKCCYLMSEINEKQNNLEPTTEWLSKARETYSRVLKKSKLEDPASIDEHKIWMSK